MKSVDTSPLIHESQLRSDMDILLKEKTQSCTKDLAELLKKNQKDALDELKIRLKKTPYFMGDVFARLMADYTDMIIKNLYQFALTYLGYEKTPFELCLVAVGGYGRQEMAPFSDIDLLFLIPEKKQKQHTELIYFMLHILWDINAKVGQSVRNVKECIDLSLSDNTICTTILDARFIIGSQTLYHQLEAQYKEKLCKKNSHQFITDKLNEREVRYKKSGQSRFLLEPDIKLGKGGLRDMQMLVWLNKFSYGLDHADVIEQTLTLTRKDKRRYRRSFRFLWTIRFWMHLLSGRANEQLSFDLQKRIAEEIGYLDTPRLLGVERLMRHFFLRATEVGWLTHVVCSQLEENNKKTIKKKDGHLLSKQQQQKGFILRNGRISHRDGPDWIMLAPINMMHVFRESQRSNRPIHPILLRVIRQHSSRMTQLQSDPDAISLFWEILTSKNSATIIRTMGNLGVLSRFIPAWGPIKCQMQYNMYHHYTTDEHTIIALSEYHEIQEGLHQKQMPWISELTQQIDPNSHIMPISILLHDIAKGRQEDHSILGAEMALDICPRLGLDADQTQMVSWLIRHHLYMSNVSSRRDLDDSQTIDEFIQKVSTPEQLRYLTLLTICDIRAVGPNVWNEWKSSLLRKLFVRASARISGQSHKSLQREEIAVAQYQLHQKLVAENWLEDEIKHLAEIATPSWWLGFPPKAQYFHANLLKKHNGKDIKVQIRANVNNALNEMITIAPDQKGIFAKISGALALSNVNIVDARAVTLHNGLILDAFSFTDVLGRMITNPHKIERIQNKVAQALSDQIDWDLESQKLTATLPTQNGKKYTHFDDYTRVLIPKNASTSATVIEVTGKDRPGFLFDITKAIMHFDLKIVTARIATYGEKVIDVFYIKDQAGLPVSSPRQLEALKKALLKASAKQNAFDYHH